MRDLESTHKAGQLPAVTVKPVHSASQLFQGKENSGRECLGSIHFLPSAQTPLLSFTGQCHSSVEIHTNGPRCEGDCLLTAVIFNRSLSHNRDVPAPTVTPPHSRPLSSPCVDTGTIYTIRIVGMYPCVCLLHRPLVFSGVLVRLGDILQHLEGSRAVAP